MNMIATMLMIAIILINYKLIWFFCHIFSVNILSNAYSIILNLLVNLISNVKLEIILKYKIKEKIMQRT